MASLKFLLALLSLTAGPALPQTVPVEEFARRPEAWEVALSPTGEYAALAVPTPDGLESRLHIVQLATGSTQVLRFGLQQHITDVLWSADDQVVVSRAQMEPLKVRPESTGELFTTDVKGKKQDMLFGYLPSSGMNTGMRKDEGWSSVVKVLDAEPGKVLVGFNCWNCGEDPATVIYKVDTRSGARQQIERGEHLAEFEFDQTGEPRFRVQWNDEDLPVVAWRQKKGGEWSPLPKAIAGYVLSNVRFEPDNNVAYAMASDAGEPAQLYRIDLAAGTREKLAGRDDVAVARILFEGRDGPPFAVYYDASKPEVQYIKPDSPWAVLHKSLMDAAPGMMVTFGNSSRDGSKVGFFVWSDRSPGTYYVYDRNTKKVQKVIEYMPRLKPDAMAQTRLFSFNNAHGDKLYGLYTATNPGRRPLVVMPHGGPFGIYDSWSFASDVQFLASRGYAVLQINYRGSGGRGRRFQQAGWLGWGTTLQDDIADGVRYATSHGLADANRVCIMGGSFGGYSALLQPILHPDLYKCAIGYVGVYDLPLMRKTDRSQGASRRTQRFFDRTQGADMQALAAISPAQRAADIKVPVLLVHGRDDRTADLNQYKTMEAALRKAGNEPQTLLVSGEGHGFFKPENIAEFYKRMEAFLETNLRP